MHQGCSSARCTSCGAPTRSCREALAFLRTSAKERHPMLYICLRELEARRYSGFQ